MVLQEGERVTVWHDGLHDVTVRRCNGRYQWLAFTRKGIEHWADIHMSDAGVESTLELWHQHDQPQEAPHSA